MIEQALDYEGLKHYDTKSKEYIEEKVSNFAPKASPTFTGTPKAPTATTGTNTTQIATTAFVQNEIANLVGTAPDTLNTLEELAEAIEEHQEVTDLLTEAISKKANADDLTNHISNSDIHVSREEIIGENLLPYPYNETSHTEDNVVWTDNGDGTVTANGTATSGQTSIFYFSKNYTLPKGKYVMSGCPTNGSGTTYDLRFVEQEGSNVLFSAIDTGNGITFELTETKTVFIFARIASGVTVNNLTFKPMLEKGSVAHEYQPYKLSRQGLRNDIDNNVDAKTLSGKSLLPKNSTDTWDAIPFIDDKGVMEVGKYIDFHTTDSNTDDYNVRIIANEDGLTLGGNTNLNIKTPLKITDDAGVVKSVMQIYNPAPDEKATYGSEIVLSGGGNVFIGSGENPNTLRTTLANAETILENEAYTVSGERMYLSSDTALWFYSNCNTIANRKAMVFDGNGVLSPLKANEQDLGITTRPWRDAYFSRFRLYKNGESHGYYGIYTEGTTSTKGDTRLVLGTKIASGNDNNSVGKIFLYGENTGHTSIIPTNNTTSNITINLPSTSGTLYTHTTITTATDFDTLKTTGIYHIKASGNTNAPTTNHGTLLVDFDIGTPYQIFTPDNISNCDYKRNFKNNAWTDWVQRKFTDTTYSNMTAATSSAAGTSGLVPAPAKGAQGKFLRGDGTWQTPTNTTYSAATTSANGLMSKEDKTKLDNTNVAYGTCSTAAATAAKVITVSGNTNWVLKAGSMIAIKFTNTNTAQNPTFNVNNTGAKSVWYNTAVITTSNLGYAGYASRIMNFIYDGTQYVFIGWSVDVDTNTKYSNAGLGQGYGTCTTAAATAAKVVTLSSYALTTGGIVSVKFTNAVPASATMNINSKGAKKIFYRGAAITAGIINAGDIATFIYDGTQYHLISIDKGILNITAKGALGYAASTGPNLIPTVSTIAYWNGAYSGTSSNLSYCNKGAFGAAAVKNVDTTVTKDSVNLITSGGVHTALANYLPLDGTATKVQGNYVTHTSETWYAPTFYSAGDTTGSKTLSSNNGWSVGFSAGTTDSDGRMTIVLGNKKASGTENNMRGCLRLYDKNTYYVNLYYGNGDTTASRNIYFPNADGTLALEGHTHDYLPSSGGAVTGTLTAKTMVIANTDTALADGAIQNMLGVKYKDAGNQTFTTYPIRVVGSTQESAYNASILLGSNNGSTILASGESSSTMPAKISAYNNEHLYLTSDGTIRMYTGCANDASSYTEALIIANNGSATFKNTVTAPTFSGALNGTASNATQLGNKSLLAKNATDTWEGIPYVDDKGVMEIGRYIDFHSTDGNTVDYDARIIATTAGLTLSGTTSGTFSGNLTGNVTGNADTATKVYSTLTNPTSAKTYSLPFHTDATSGNKSILNNDGIRYRTLEGTTSENGYGILYLGNDVVSGTAANKYGAIRMYGSGGYYTQLRGLNATANRTINFPDAGGTVSLEGHTHSGYAASDHTHSGYLTPSGGTLNNNATLSCKNTSGTAISALTMNTSNQLKIGQGAGTIHYGAHGTTSRMQLFASNRIDLCINASGTGDGNNAAISAVYETIYDQSAGASSTSGTVLRPTSLASFSNLGSSEFPFYTLYYQYMTKQSDRNVKTDIEDLSDKYITLWDKLKAKSYHYINNMNSLSLGLIAQDVESAAQEAGLSLADCGFISKAPLMYDTEEGQKQKLDSNGEPEYRYGLDYTFVSILNLAKLKETASKVDVLETENKELKERIARLESKIQ